MCLERRWGDSSKEHPEMRRQAGLSSQKPVLQKEAFGLPTEGSGWEKPVLQKEVFGLPTEGSAWENID